MIGPPERREPQPGGNGCGPLDFIATGNSDGRETTLEIDQDQLRPRAVRPDELLALRRLWWHQAGAGHPLPPEIGVIVVEGGRP